ncbi:hypothetical protein P8C59_003757 [Phyllachora maydis]|uniref:Cupin type-2 domain-containing protein n=1 Tax=Phyllachora maydis TaxID=1825666 RepID=A0AAD9MCR1_9PEZI|nr:hypothetical protein P8C59_003757 [Phyllachora maydis]
MSISCGSTASTGPTEARSPSVADAITLSPVNSHSPLPPVRRIVTGHDSVGQAIFEADDLLTAFDSRRAVAAVTKRKQEAHTARNPGESGIINLFRTDGFPAPVQGPWTEVNGKAIPLCAHDGTTLRVVDLPPGYASPMHRTQSVDFCVVLAGEVVLEVSNNAEKTVRAGEVCVLRGTMHAWHNRTTTIARVLVFLVPAEPIEVNGEALEPCGFNGEDERMV